MGNGGQTTQGFTARVLFPAIVLFMSAENKEMLKSWAKVFLSSAFALYAAGSTNILDVVNAGLIAVLPLVWTWLDPNDPRFGRHK